MTPRFRRRYDRHGRRSVSDRSLRPAERLLGKPHAPSDEVLDVVLMLLEDAGAPMTQRALTEAMCELYPERPAGTCQGWVSRALLWLHREGFVVFVGRESGENGYYTNVWRLPS